MKLLGLTAQAFGTAMSGTGAAAASLAVSDVTSRYIGVPAPVVIAAVIGTIAGIALGDPITPRGKLFGHAFAYTVLGAAVASFLPFLMGWKLDEPMRAALAVAASAIMRWLWPAITENLKNAVSNLFNIFTRKE